MKWIMAAPSLARARTDLVVIPISDEAVNKAIALRQQPKMSPADSILAATASENHWELVSRNVGDFKWIAGLRLVPFDFRP
jgi:predicted nucleic acid-binding protein